MLNNFQVPDLTKLCGEHFELRVNSQCHAVTLESYRWLAEQGILLATALPDSDSDASSERHAALQLPLLASLWYPTCDFTQLKTATDLLTLLFYEDYHAEVVDVQALQSALDGVVSRMKHAMNEQSSWGTRFQSTLARYHDARRTVAELQSNTRTLPISEHLALKRSSEIFDIAFSLHEYTEDLHIADEVLDSPVMRGLKENALDAVIWMKGIVAYNIQQSRGDANNLVATITKENGITLQAAINQATDSVRECLQRFVELASGNEAAVLDEKARRQVLGLRDSIVGWAHWVYETQEYFSKNGEEVKAFGWVFLLPKEGEGEGEGR